MPKGRAKAKASSGEEKVANQNATDAMVTPDKPQNNMQAAELAGKDNGVNENVEMSDKPTGNKEVIDLTDGVAEDVVMSEEPIVISEKAQGKQKATDNTFQGNDNNEVIETDRDGNVLKKSKNPLKKTVVTAPSMPFSAMPSCPGDPNELALWNAIETRDEALFANLLGKYLKAEAYGVRFTKFDLAQNHEFARHAIEKGTKTQIILLLTKVKVNFYGPRQGKGSALAEAAKQGDKDMVNIIYNLGCVVDMGYDRSGGDALHAAAAAGQSTIVESLLRRGMPVDVLGGDFGYPLQAAMCGGPPGDIMCLSLLLQGIGVEEVNARGGVYGTALNAAVARGRKILVKMLLDTGLVYKDSRNEALEAAKDRVGDLSGRDKEIAKGIVEMLEKAANLKTRPLKWEDVADLKKPISKSEKAANLTTPIVKSEKADDDDTNVPIKSENVDEDAPDGSEVEDDHDKEGNHGEDSGEADEDAAEFSGQEGDGDQFED